MEMPKVKFSTVDEYIAFFEPHIAARLEEIRTIIKQAAPQAQETISYNMPAYKQNGVLVWFAGYEKHIGFYPSASPIVVFKEALTPYKTSKGAIQFTLKEAIPAPLVTDIVNYRIKETEEKAKKKTR